MGDTEVPNRRGYYHHCHAEKKHRENCKTLHREHLISCQVVQMFLLKTI